jgi:hypothetical protein
VAKRYTRVLFKALLLKCQAENVNLTLNVVKFVKLHLFFGLDFGHLVIEQRQQRAREIPGDHAACWVDTRNPGYHSRNEAS